MTIPRRGAAAMIGLLMLVTACGTPASAPSDGPAAAPTVQAVIAASTIVVGPNRLPIGIVVDGTPVNNPAITVHLRFYYLDGDAATQQDVVGETDTTYYGHNLPLGVYVAYPNLPRAGGWGLEVETTLPGQAPVISRLRLDVREQDPTPALGTPAITVDSPVAAGAADLPAITSDPQPNLALYQISVAEALKTKKPLAILFGTPGFCKTATCGPSIQVMGRLQEVYGDRMNFIHVETYHYPFAESVAANPPRLSAGMTAWGLQSEPWVFLIDATGIIRAKYEGGITEDELTPVLDAVLASPGGWIQ